MKTERTQIHFLSDVLVAVASLDLKVPILVLITRGCLIFCDVIVNESILRCFSSSSIK